MRGLLNGYVQPDRGDITLAPQLGALASLYATSEFADYALRAAHPGLEGIHPANGLETRSLRGKAAEALGAIGELRVRLRRYADQLGIELLWLPPSSRPSAASSPRDGELERPGTVSAQSTDEKPRGGGHHGP